MSVSLRAVSASVISAYVIPAVILACLGASSVRAQAPIIDDGRPAHASTPAPTGNDSITGQLYLQLQALQQQVANLRGSVEELRHEVKVMKQQGLDRYNDLDQRINRLQGGAPAAGAAAASAASSAASAASAPAAAAAGAASSASTPAAARAETAKPAEYDAYEAAFAKLKGQDFRGAIKAFNDFLANYPHGILAPNSYYWLGKAYQLVQPQDLKKAQESFEKVSGFPHSNKVPDALYELGKLYFLKGDKTKAKQLLQKVIDDYGSSSSSAPQLAKQFLDQNFPAGKSG